MSFVNEKQPYTAIPYATITVPILTLAHTFDLTYNKINAPQLRVTQHSNSLPKKLYVQARKRIRRTANYTAPQQRKTYESHIQNTNPLNKG